MFENLGDKLREVHVPVKCSEERRALNSKLISAQVEMQQGLKIVTMMWMKKCNCLLI